MTEEFDFLHDESKDDSMEELKAVAFEYLLLNPGSEFGDWQKGLIEEYPSEVIDALGSIPADVYAGLADLWESEYTDLKTGIYKDFHEWAECFANEQAVDIYYRLVEACSISS
ncbi:MAG: hypothetical protein HDS81_06340 [Bacteroidales bacterium]|nr:hypothetical protein [Bacteroidales bacterium]